MEFFQDTDIGYQNALRFLRAEKIRFLSTTKPAEIVAFANEEATACNLLIIDHDCLNEICYALRKSPPLVWEQDVVIPQTGQIVSFRKQLNDHWEPVTPVLYILG